MRLFRRKANLSKIIGEAQREGCPVLQTRSIDDVLQGISDDSQASLIDRMVNRLRAYVQVNFYDHYNQALDIFDDLDENNRLKRYWINKHSAKRPIVRAAGYVLAVPAYVVIEALTIGPYISRMFPLDLMTHTTVLVYCVSQCAKSLSVREGTRTILYKSRSRQKPGIQSADK